MEYRVESDTIGEVKIPKEALWGPQTERSRHNFQAGPEMPLELIKALLRIKRDAAKTNLKLANLDSEKAELIVAAVDALLSQDDDQLRQEFPLKVYQTGSGTQTNMNVNEVVANMAKRLNPQIEILPNDDVNRGQSSNDVFPTAMNITAHHAVIQLIDAVEELRTELSNKESEFATTVKIGRTHLQDATPLTFGQEISGWIAMLDHDIKFLTQLNDSLRFLAIGGTAVGTGLNAVPGFASGISELLSEDYDADFSAETNKFAGLAAHSELNVVHGAVKTLAADLMKIANDIRFLASGPRAGYGELHIPANEPGSSIMPGKVNPTQAEALTMAATKVMGNDVTIDIAASQGNFEMNVYKPVIIQTFLESTDLLTKTSASFATNLVAGMTVNPTRMRELVDNSLMTVTALSPHIGYHDSAKIAQTAEKEGLTLKQAALQSGLVTEAQFDVWVDPLKMTNAQKEDK